MDMETKPQFKCRNCKVCNGYGCIDQMPGMGGPNHNRNFILNCAAWKDAYKTLREDTIAKLNGQPAAIRLAPMTGAVENVGYEDEKNFYSDLVHACLEAGALLSIGDGCPDTKLQFGIEAVKKENAKASVFIKPYTNEKIFERLEWADGIMDACGVDIDSYNIITMRNKVNLEKKTASQLKELQTHLNTKGIPFAVKGVFTQEDLDLVCELKPDIIYVSNHGGRVETEEGSVFDFLSVHKTLLEKNCGQIWVDGGIRTRNDILTAQAYGAQCILLGRPFATALCYDKANGIQSLMQNLTGGAA